MSFKCLPFSKTKKELLIVEDKWRCLLVFLEMLTKIDILINSHLSDTRKVQKCVHVLGCQDTFFES